MSVKVFISSRLDEFIEERAHIARMLIHEMGLIPVYFENEPAGGHLPGWWREKIADSDIYILLIGKDISWPIVDELLSAKQLARPIVILANKPKLLAEGGLRIIDNERWTNKNTDVKEFYDFVSNQKWKDFRTSDDLKNEVRAGVSKYLGVKSKIPLDIVVERDRVDRVRQVFVPPSQYVDARDILMERKLVVISGPPHIGKTATALQLLWDAIEAGKAITLIELRDVSSIGSLRNLKNLAILVDDVFGAVQPEVENFADRWEELEAIARNNFVVATSRTEVIESAFRETKLSKRVLTEQTINLDANSYSMGDRETIAKKHLTLWESEGRQFKALNVVTGHTQYIARKLQFPHNIAYFIEFYGHIVQNQKELFHYVNESLVIEEEIAKWLSRTERNIRLFVIALALYEGAREDELTRAYERLCSVVGEIGVPSGEILEKVRSYITVERTWRFRHPSYRLAVLEKGYELYGDLLLSYMRSAVSKAMLDLDLGSKTKKTLGIFGIRHPIRALRELYLLTSFDVDLDRDARVAVRAIGQKHPYETLEELLSWPNSKAVFRLVGGVVSRLSHRPKAEVDEWGPLLTKAMSHPDPAFRWRIANLIQRFASRKPKEALPLVVRLSNDESPKVRKAAVTATQALGAQIPGKALKLLQDMKDDPDETVRKYVIGRIKEIRSNAREIKKIGLI